MNVSKKVTSSSERGPIKWDTHNGYIIVVVHCDFPAGQKVFEL